MSNDKKNAVRIFDEKQIRGVWDIEAEKWLVFGCGYCLRVDRTA